MKYLVILLALVSFGFGQGKWVEQENPFTGSATYRDVCFVDSLTGYVLTWGKVVKTADGGKTWEVQDLPDYPSVSAVTVLNKPLSGGIIFIDSLRGWVARPYGIINATSDGGKTWSCQLIDTVAPPGFYDIEFVNERKGWVVGDGWAGGDTFRSVILHTEDGGKNWVYQDSLTYPTLNAVTFFDTLKGFAVGDSGLILRTLDGGTHWDSVPSGTKNSLYDIQFADSVRGIIVAYHGSNLVSKDGGNTWEEVTNGAHGWDLAFPDTSHAWCVVTGSVVGGIYFSQDGGITWEQQSCGVDIDFLYGVSFPDTAHGWAVGTQGKIINYSLGAGIKETDKTEFGDYQLQIYPNPFRKAVTIVYQPAVFGEVSLRIYNAAGLLVRSLTLESKYHTSFWDGRDNQRKAVPQGVYFLKFEVSGKTLGCKKLVLLD